MIAPVYFCRSGSEETAREVFTGENALEDARLLRVHFEEAGWSCTEIDTLSADECADLGLPHPRSERAAAIWHGIGSALAFLAMLFIVGTRAGMNAKATDD